MSVLLSNSMGNPITYTVSLSRQKFRSARVGQGSYAIHSITSSARLSSAHPRSGASFESLKGLRQPNGALRYALLTQEFQSLSRGAPSRNVAEATETAKKKAPTYTEEYVDMLVQKIAGDDGIKGAGAKPNFHVSGTSASSDAQIC